ncbi:MAG: hypothetical protein QXJ69_01335 [Desulfurococcaceae archaeon]
MTKKHKKLTDFIKKPSAPGEEDAKQNKKEAENRQIPSSEEESEFVFEELVKLIEQKQKSIVQQEEAVESRKPVAKSEVKEEREPKPFEEDKIINVAHEAFLKDITVIECNKQGICVDGRRLGEVFEDSRGLKWQRSFLNTTRIPIYLDFIAEEAEIKGRVGKALVVVSSRGAKAIIPDDFICEAVSRYGIILDIDKCVNYRPSPWADKARKKQK